MTEGTDQEAQWVPWCVEPHSGFEVNDGSGKVELAQISHSQFLVSPAFRYCNEELEASLEQVLVDAGKTADAARRAVDDARTFTPSENPTDLASVPLFMRWFENTYGAHTLAAILHDNLITDIASGGALGSDALADHLFREMMRSAGVPWLKRWIMWSAVALRSRWAAGGYKRVMIGLWLVTAVVGIAAFVNGVGAALLDWGHIVDVPALFAVAAILPFASAPLWGKQLGASFIAAIAALWVMPAALLAVFGFFVYRALEFGARAIGLD